MKKRYLSLGLVFMASMMIAATDPECDDSPAMSSTTQAASGVNKATVAVRTQSNGRTVEQENVARRLQLENAPGAIQHLYVLSAYSGQVLLYSTVKGKVTSSSKRLSPSTRVEAYYDRSGEYYPEVLGDDGTYGSSIDYLYWWDVQGRYHQQYVTGGIFVHISDQPTQFGRVTMQVETTQGAK